MVGFFDEGGGGGFIPPPPSPPDPYLIAPGPIEQAVLAQQHGTTPVNLAYQRRLEEELAAGLRSGRFIATGPLDDPRTRIIDNPMFGIDEAANIQGITPGQLFEDIETQARGAEEAHNIRALTGVGTPMEEAILRASGGEGSLLNSPQVDALRRQLTGQSAFGKLGDIASFIGDPIIDILGTDIPSAIRDPFVRAFGESLENPLAGPLSLVLRISDALGDTFGIGPGIGGRDIAEFFTPREAWELGLEAFPGVGSGSDIYRALRRSSVDEFLPAARSALSGALPNPADEAGFIAFPFGRDPQPPPVAAPGLAPAAPGPTPAAQVRQLPDGKWEATIPRGTGTTRMVMNTEAALQSALSRMGIPVAGVTPAPTTLTPEEALVRLVGERPEIPGRLTRLDRMLNPVRDVLSRVELPGGIRFETTVEIDDVTPLMRMGTRQRQIGESVAARLGAIAGEVARIFNVDDSGRIPHIAGAPTIADVAAKLPQYDPLLSTPERNALARLKQELEPFSRTLDDLGLVIRERSDIEPGGFYIPRGRASREGADAPLLTQRRALRGGRKGFERPATVDTQVQGIDNGLRYARPQDAIQDYVRDGINRVVDKNIADNLLKLSDDVGNPLFEHPADRIDRILQKQVNALRAKIATRVHTLTGREARLGELSKEFDRRARETGRGSARTDTKAAVVVGLEAATPAGVTDAALSYASGELRALQQELNRLVKAAGKAGDRSSGMLDRIQETRSEIKRFTDELNSLKGRWEQAKELARQIPIGEAKVDLRSLENYSTDVLVASVVNKHLKTANANPSVIRAVNSLFRGLWSTGDKSFLGIQGLLGAITDPKAYAKALAVAQRGFLDPHVLGREIMRFDDDAVRRGLPASGDWVRAGLRLAAVDTEFAIKGRFIVNAGDLPLVKNFNREFGFFGDDLRLELAQDIFNAHRFSPKYAGDTERLMRESAEAANLMTGWSRGRFLGDVGEFAQFAPRYFQSQLELVTRAFTDFHSVTGEMARKSLVKLVGYGTLVTVAANEALGNEGFDYLSPVTKTADGKTIPNPNFMRIRAGGLDISVFGTWDTLVKAMMSAAMGDPEYLLRSKASPTVAMAWDLFTGKTFTGESVHNPETWARRLLPFSMSEVGQEPWLATLVGTLGVKASPMTRAESFNRDLANTMEAEIKAGTLPQTYRDSQGVEHPLTAVWQLKPEDQDAFWQRHPELRDRFRNELASPTSRAIARIQDDYRKQQQADDDTILRTNPQEWRHRRSERAQNEWHAVNGLFADPTHAAWKAEQDARAPRTIHDAVSRKYYDTITKNTAPNGTVNWDAVDREVASWTNTEQQVLFENRLGGKTDAEKRHVEDLRQIVSYLNQRDAAWAKIQAARPDLKQYPSYEEYRTHLINQAMDKNKGISRSAAQRVIDQYLAPIEDVLSRQVRVYLAANQQILPLLDRWGYYVPVEFQPALQGAR